MELRTVWLACVPPGHGCGALEPSTHRKPAVQLLHAVLPESGVNLPAGHKVHVCWPAVGLYAPGKQGAGSAEPTEHDVPTGQTMQSLVRLLR